MPKSQNPRHRKFARPAIGAGAIAVITGLVLSTFAVIAGPIAPSEAATQYHAVVSEDPTLDQEGEDTQGDEAIEDSPVADGDQTQGDLTDVPLDELQELPLDMSAARVSQGGGESESPDAVGCVPNPTWSYTWNGSTSTGSVTATGGAPGQLLCTPLYLRAATWKYDTPVTGATPSWPQTLNGKNDYTINTIGTHPFAAPGMDCGQDDIYATFSPNGFGALAVGPKLTGPGVPYEPKFLHNLMSGTGGVTWHTDSSYGCGSTGSTNPEVAIVKSASVASTAAGGSFNYTLTVTNPGSGTAQQVVVTDTLPADLVLAGEPTIPANWTFEHTGNDLTFTLSGGLSSAAPAQIFTIPVTVIADPDAQEIENQAEVCAYNTSPDCDNDNVVVPLSSLDVVVGPQCIDKVPYLDWDLSTHNIDFAVNNLLTFVWTPLTGPVQTWTAPLTSASQSMSGQFTLPGTLVDGLGNGTTFPGWSFTNGRWVFDEDAPGVVLNSNPGLSIAVGSLVSAFVEYPEHDNNCTGQFGVAVLDIQKDASVQSTEAGDGYYYTVTVTNPSSADALNPVVTDTLPADLDLAGTPTVQAGWSYLLSPDGRTLTFSLAGLLVAETGSATFTIPVTVSDEPDADIIENSAMVCADNAQEDCDTDTAFTPIKSIDLAVQTICIGNVPYLHYDIAIHNVDLTTFTQVAYEWAPITGPAEASGFLPAAPTMSGNVLWPGAEVDSFGNATDWPGWTFAGGSWFFDPTAPGATLRDDSHVTVSINPTTTVVASYPPESSACANPPSVSVTSFNQPPTGVSQSSTGVAALSSTGVGAFGVSAIALGSLALGFGFVLLFLSKRSRRQGR